SRRRRRREAAAARHARRARDRPGGGARAGRGPHPLRHRRHHLRPRRHPGRGRHRARGARAHAGAVNWRPLGDRALRAERPPGIDAATLLATLRSRPGVVDVILTDAWVAVTFADAPPDLAGDFTPVVPPPPREHVVRVRYDGPDLDAFPGLGPAEVAARHAAATYTVLFLGFAPGFASLGGLDPALVVPRRASPRPRVPAGAVGVADRYTAVYPFATPGGWNLVGTAVDFTPFTAD